MNRIVLTGVATLALLAAGCSAATTTDSKPTGATSATPTTPTVSAPGTRQSAKPTGNVKAATSATDPLNCSLLTEADVSKILGTPMTKNAMSGLGVGQAVEGNQILQACSMNSATGVALTYSIATAKDAKALLKKAIDENSKLAKIRQIDVADGAYSLKSTDTMPTMSFAAIGDYSMSVMLKAKDVATEDANIPVLLKALADKVQG